MKKSVLLILSILLISIFSFTIISAANETASDELQDFDKAYDCLENLVVDRGYDDLTSEELSFALLALGYDAGIQGELRSALTDISLDNRCWPGDDCEVKETALAMMALNNLGQSTNFIEEWILEETTEPRDLDWYLQIDTTEEAECTISYEGGSRDVDIGEDKKVTGAGGQCFRSAYNGYWIQIDEDCFDESLEVTCDKSFVTSLIYKRTTGSTLSSPYYVSALTNSAPADGKTTENVQSLCFKREGSTSCDYEATLWASLVLKKLGKDTKAYLPYLIALSDNYDQHLPSAFLYMLTGDEEYFLELANKQKADGYWQATSNSNQRYYDTAVALFALMGRSTEQETKATEWLIETQPDSGCWKNARDTSFILYAVSPQRPTTSSERFYCEDSGFFCVSTSQTCEEAAGTLKPAYTCLSPSTDLCCTVDVDEELPDVEPTLEDELESECLARDYSCRISCNEGTEEFIDYECPEVGYDCCAPAAPTPVDEGGFSIWLIIILLILIVLLILAIIYRNQLKIWFFRVKSKFQKKPVSPGTRQPMQLQSRPGQRPGMPRRPGMPPRRQFTPMQGRRPGQPMPRRPGQKPFSKEAELQDTLDKLKKMGK